MAVTSTPARRVLLHLEHGRRVPMEPDEVFLLEADGDRTIVRTWGRRNLCDLRSLGEAEALQRLIDRLAGDPAEKL